MSQLTTKELDEKLNLENPDAHLQEMESRARSGDAEAAYCLGKYFYEPKNQEECRRSLEFLEMASAQNHVDAQYLLGLLFLYGNEFMPPSEPRGETLLRKASEQGHAWAKCSLGSYYQSKDDCIDLAIKLFGESLKLGNLTAGPMLIDLLEINQRIDEAKEAWRSYIQEIEKQVGQNNAEAVSAYVSVLITGSRYQIADHPKALEMALREIEEGRQEHLYSVAWLYKNGIHVQRDEAKSEHFRDLAKAREDFDFWNEYYSTKIFIPYFEDHGNHVSKIKTMQAMGAIESVELYVGEFSKYDQMDLYLPEDWQEKVTDDLVKALKECPPEWVRQYVNHLTRYLSVSAHSGFWDRVYRRLTA